MINCHLCSLCKITNTYSRANTQICALKQECNSACKATKNDMKRLKNWIETTFKIVTTYMSIRLCIFVAKDSQNVVIFCRDSAVYNKKQLRKSRFPESSCRFQRTVGQTEICIRNSFATISYFIRLNKVFCRVAMHLKPSDICITMLSFSSYSSLFSAAKVIFAVCTD